MKYSLKTIGSIAIAILAMFVVGTITSGCNVGGTITGYVDEIPAELPEDGDTGDDGTIDQDTFAQMEGDQDGEIPEVDGAKGVSVNFGDQEGDALDESCLNDEDGNARLAIRDNNDGSEVNVRRVALRDDNRRANVTAALKHNKDYTLILRQGLCKEDGTTLDSDQEIAFRTLPNQCDILGNGNRATFVWHDAGANFAYAFAGENFTGERDDRGDPVVLDMDSLRVTSWSYPPIGPRLVFRPEGIYNMCNGGDAFMFGEDVISGDKELWYSYNLTAGFDSIFGSSIGTMLGGQPLYADIDGDGNYDFAALDFAPPAPGARSLYRTNIFPGDETYSSDVFMESASDSFRQAPAIGNAKDLLQAGDVNGDGLADLLIFDIHYFTTLEINIHYGSAAASLSETPSATIIPAPGYQLTGLKLGDVNGDGFDDMVVSLTAGFPIDEGRVAIILGSASLPSEIIVPSSSTYAVIYCETAATSVRSCGNNPNGLLVLDFNKDGFDDIFISSPLYAEGVVSLFYGGESISADSVFEADAYFQPTRDYYRFGENVSSFGDKYGDVNNDGYPDIIIFSTNSRAAGTYRHTIYAGQDVSGVLTEADAFSVIYDGP